MTKVYICIRCLSVNKLEELLSSNKIKGVSLEESRRFKVCKEKKCKCRTFYV